MNTVQIIAGQLRRRKITFASHQELRPTTSRCREMLFNWLQPYTLVSALDAFAGSGVLGFEAYSRGVQQITFMETSQLQAGYLRKNAQLCMRHVDGGKITVEQRDAFAYIRTQPLQFDIMFIDPPFQRINTATVIATIDQRMLATPMLIYAESPVELLPTPRFEIIKQRRVASVFAALYSNHAIIPNTSQTSTT